MVKTLRPASEAQAAHPGRPLMAPHGSYRDGRAQRPVVSDRGGGGAQQQRPPVQWRPPHLPIYPSPPTPCLPTLGPTLPAPTPSPVQPCTRLPSLTPSAGLTKGPAQGRPLVSREGPAPWEQGWVEAGLARCMEPSLCVEPPPTPSEPQCRTDPESESNLGLPVHEARGQGVEVLVGGGRVTLTEGRGE